MHHTEVTTMLLLSLLFACKPDPVATSDTDLPAPPTPPQSTADTSVPVQDTGDVLTCGIPDGDLASALGAHVQLGNNCGAGNDFPVSCSQAPAGRGEDLAYTWTAPAAGDYTFDTIGSEADTLLTLRTECPENEELACHDDIDLNHEVFTSSITHALTANQTIVIVIDGWNASANENPCGHFVLNIREGGSVVDTDSHTGTPNHSDTGR